MAKAVTKKAKDKIKKSSYLTKRVLQRAISKGTRHTSEEVLQRRGYIITVKDGWLVKVKSDGSEEKLSRLPKAKTYKQIVLD